MAYRTRYIGGGSIHIVPPELVYPHSHIEEPAYRLAARRRYNRLKANTVGAKYVLRDIAKRDDYRCHLCGHIVDMALPGTHQKGPTADHLVPVAHGGGNESRNVALAHRWCNVKRGTGGTAQLRLVG
jgi:5-methylcytosine-specific restriction endonuclease McrA